MQHLILGTEALYSSTLGKFGLDSEYKLYLYCFIQMLKKNKVAWEFFVVAPQWYVLKPEVFLEISPTLR